MVWLLYYCTLSSYETLHVKNRAIDSVTGEVLNKDDFARMLADDEEEGWDEISGRPDPFVNSVNAVSDETPS